MTDRDTVRRALCDAIDWQDSLADAWQAGSPERAEARAQANRYRSLMNKRYGTRRLPMEHALDGATTVTLAELRERTREK